MKNNHLYFVHTDFIICDTDFAENSERTVTMSFLDLANNVDLLAELQFERMYANTNKSLTFFANYITAFSSNSTSKERQEKLLTNPQIKIILINEILLDKVKNLLSV